MDLATCGCQLSGFACVLCKKRYIFHYNLPDYYCPTGYPYPLPQAYRYLPSTIKLVHTYYRYKTCVTGTTESERSATCPKKVYPNGYICARCKVKSMNKLYESNTLDLLQDILELKKVSF